MTSASEGEVWNQELDADTRINSVDFSRDLLSSKSVSTRFVRGAN